MKKCSQEKFISTIRNFVTRGLKKYKYGILQGLLGKNG
jgi:hypothetical protein